MKDQMPKFMLEIISEIEFDFRRFAEVYYFDKHRMKLKELEMFNLN